MDKQFEKEFNKKYYNPRISNEEIESLVLEMPEDNRAIIYANIIVRKPWDLTSRTTLLILIPVIIAAVFMQIFMMVFHLLPISNNSSSINENKEYLFSLIAGIMSFSQSLTLVFIMTTGFAFIMPGMYNYETNDFSLRSYTNSSKTLVFNGTMYEIVDRGDRVFVRKTTSPGFGALALNAIKALFYQFKKEFAYKDLLLQIEADSEVKKTILEMNIKKILDDKRFNKTNKLLLINYFLTLSMYIRVPLMIIIVFVFCFA